MSRRLRQKKPNLRDHPRSYQLPSVCTPTSPEGRPKFPPPVPLPSGVSLFSDEKRKTRSEGRRRRARPNVKEEKRSRGPQETKSTEIREAQCAGETYGEQRTYPLSFTKKERQRSSDQTTSKLLFFLSLVSFQSSFVKLFTVPNPNCTSQRCRFFQVWLSCRLPRLTDHPV